MRVGIGEHGRKVDALDRRSHPGRSTPARAQIVAARSTWEARASVTVPGSVTPGTLHVEGHPHDLLVDERALRPQPVRTAHVPVVGREDDDRVVPRPRRLERGEDRSEAAVGERVQVHVVVEVPEPRPLVGRDRCCPTARAAGPTATVDALRAWRAGRRRSSRAAGRTPRGRDRRRPGADRHPSMPPPPGSGSDPGHLVGVAVGVPGLVDREPHHVMGVDQGDGEEPWAVLGPAGVLARASGRRWMR